MSYRSIPVIHASWRRQLQRGISSERDHQKERSLFKAKSSSSSLSFDQTPHCAFSGVRLASVVKRAKLLCNCVIVGSNGSFHQAWIRSQIPPCWLWSYRKWSQRKNKFYEFSVCFPVTAWIGNFEECGEPAVAFHDSVVLFQDSLCMFRVVLSHTSGEANLNIICSWLFFHIGEHCSALRWSHSILSRMGCDERKLPNLF